MKDESVRSPGRMHSLLRSVVALSAAVAGSWALFVLGCIAFWIDAQFAIREWESLGGAISVAGNLTAPEMIILGASPHTSGDVDAICGSLRRMRRLPGCVRLNLNSMGEFGFDDVELGRMLEAFEPVELEAFGAGLDDDALRLLASNGRTEYLFLDGCPVTEQGLGDLLDQSLIRRVVIRSNDLTDTERERLQTKYGDRIAFR